MSTELISALTQPSVYPHPTSLIKVLETHVSWVILTGDYAYKIKKPVDFGFLDFSTLPKRKHYCEAELTLNSRSTPELYVGLVAISGTPNKPAFGGSGKVIEYAVKMNQFESGQLFSDLSKAGQLRFNHINELSKQVAIFHQQVAFTDKNSPHGQPKNVFTPMQENFDFIKGHVTEEEQISQINYLEEWTKSSYERLKPLLQRRQNLGLVRECHGDMHMGNMTLSKNKVTLFDCVEFNDDLRWIDVISDVAFLVMDFEDHNLPHFANRFLNNYLEHTGDYSGLKLLTFYKTYRAIVRAKVALLTMDGIQQDSEQKAASMKQYQSYIDLAESYSGLTSRVLLTMHGLSGTGKSTVALRLVDNLGLIRIRSDIERKRLFGLNAHEHSSEAGDIYHEAATHQTYKTLCELCAEVLDAGMSAIVDATNLKYWQRQAIQQLADERGVPVCIADCQAPMAIIEHWLEKRSSENLDASEADIGVVAQQALIREPLSKEELSQAVVIKGDMLAETKQLEEKIKTELR